MRSRDITKVTKSEQSPTPRPPKQAPQTDDATKSEKHNEKAVEKEMEALADSRHCYTHYIGYQRCRKLKGNEAPECQKLAKYYHASCPAELIERWNEQVENGTFPARI